MIKIGITGSISSGKTTASKFISNKKGPLFSADHIVKKLYKSPNFRKIISRKLHLPLNLKFKKLLKRSILKDKENVKKLEKIIHPIVRSEMLAFSKKNKTKKFIFFEVPLLVENNLNRYFDKVIFIKAKKNLRLKRFLAKKGNKKIFDLLDSMQIKDIYKSKLCDYIVVNNKSLFNLKKNLLRIKKKYD